MTFLVAHENVRKSKVVGGRGHFQCVLLIAHLLEIFGAKIRRGEMSHQERLGGVWLGDILVGVLEHHGCLDLRVNRCSSFGGKGAVL